jgi:hypothetical protein
MAAEHAEITFTLTDEMSDRLQTIHAQFDGLTRRG